MSNVSPSPYHKLILAVSYESLGSVCSQPCLIVHLAFPCIAIRKIDIICFFLIWIERYIIFVKIFCGKFKAVFAYEFIALVYIFPYADIGVKYNGAICTCLLYTSDAADE